MSTNPSVSTTHDPHQRWRQRVIDQERSGLTQQAFCDGRGLAYSTFARWRRLVLDERSGARLGRPSPDDTPAFVAVAVTEPVPPPGASATLSIALPNGVRIEGIGPDTVATSAALVAAL